MTEGFIVVDVGEESIVTKQSFGSVRIGFVTPPLYARALIEFLVRQVVVVAMSLL